MMDNSPPFPACPEKMSRRTYTRFLKKGLPQKTVMGYEKSASPSQRTVVFFDERNASSPPFDFYGRRPLSESKNGPPGLPLGAGITLKKCAAAPKKRTPGMGRGSRKSPRFFCRPCGRPSPFFDPKEFERTNKQNFSKNPKARACRLRA